MDIISLNAGEVWKREDDIVVIKCADEQALNPDDVQELLDAFSRITADLPHKILVLSGIQSTATRDGRETAQQTQIPCIAEAIVVRSLTQRIICNLYIAFKTCDHPIKLFNNKESAIFWLNGLDT